MNKILEPCEIPYSPKAFMFINFICDIKCPACYFNKTNDHKPFDLIKEEIELISKTRHVETIQITGGEPTLHPELPKIIKYIVDIGKFPVLLTNGYSLTDHKLKAYHDAGLSKIVLHIDSMQIRSDALNMKTEFELNALRDKIAKMVTNNAMICEIAIIVYKNNIKELDNIINHIFASDLYINLIGTCCSYSFQSPNKISHNIIGMKQVEADQYIVKNEDILSYLKNKLGMHPAFYLPSNLRLTEKRWLLYYSICVTRKDGSFKILNLTSRLNRVFVFTDFMKKAYKKISIIKRPHTTNTLDNQLKVILSIILYALFSFDIKILRDSANILKAHMISRNKIAMHVFLFEQLANMTEDGKIEYCMNCPDLTIHNGVAVPGCCATNVDSKFCRSQ